MNDVASQFERLSEFDRASLLNFLREIGWRMVGTLGERAEVWAGPRPDDERVPLPSSDGAPDYAMRVRQLIDVLERQGQPSLERLLATSASPRWDVVKIQFDGHADGTIPLESAERLVGETRDLLLSAACAEINRRAVYPSRKPDEALAYVNSLRFGQTERGSFIMNALSPLPSEQQLQPALSPDLGDVSIPFPRRALGRLAHALEATKAFDGAETAADRDALDLAVSQGVSANLCEAASGLLAVAGIGEARLRFEWSPMRAAPDVPSEIVLRQPRMRILQHVAHVYRLMAPVDEYELRGKVIGLRRAEGEPIGSVTIRGWTGAGFRQVSLELGDPWYHTALVAHDQDTSVVAVGQLARDGHRFKLRSVTAFENVIDEGGDSKETTDIVS